MAITKRDTPTTMSASDAGRGAERRVKTLKDGAKTIKSLLDAICERKLEQTKPQPAKHAFRAKVRSGIHRTANGWKRSCSQEFQTSTSATSKG